MPRCISFILVHKFHFRMSGQHLDQSPECGSWKEPECQAAWVPVNVSSDFYKLQTDDRAPGASSHGKWAGALNTEHSGLRRGVGKRLARLLWSLHQPPEDPGQAGLSPGRTEARVRAAFTPSHNQPYSRQSIRN